MNVDIQRLSKSFQGREVLHNVSLSVPSGQLTALIGPSGSGKSTLLRIIAGLETSDSGSISFGGHEVTRLPAQARNIGFCFQDYAPFRHMSVFDNIAYGLTIRKRPKGEIRAHVNELLERMGLESHATKFPSQLSGGQRQRMSLARALAVRPSVLLLDEPFAALDAHVRSDVRSFVRGLQHELGITTILVTHDQSEAMEVADHIAVLEHGVVQQVGPPLSVYDQPANDFVKKFLGPTTSFRGTSVRPHQLLVRRDGVGERGVISDIVALGFEVRVHIDMSDGSTTWVQMTHDDALREGFTSGESVIVATRTQVISGGADDANQPSTGVARLHEGHAAAISKSWTFNEVPRQ